MKAEKELLRLKLESELEQVKALAVHSQLLKLKQLEMLKELAKEGAGKFIIGLQSDEISGLLNE